MRNILLVLFLSVVLCQSTFAVSTAWLNEPPGSELVSDWPFNSIIGGAWTAPWGVAGQIVQDPTAPLSPSNVWRNTRNATSNNNTDLLCAIPSGKQDTVYFGFWFKASDPHRGWDRRIQKIAMINQAAPHIYTMMVDIDTVSKTFALIGWEERAVAKPDTTNHHVTPDGVLQPNINSARFRVGEWHKVEIYVRRSTTSTSRNGVYMWWVDDILRGHYTTLNWEIPTWGVSLANVWDKIDTSLPFTEWIQYDHARASLPTKTEPRPVYLLISQSSPIGGATRDVAFSKTVQILASGTKGPLAWTITSGSLPTGMSLDPQSGKIYGTPTCAGLSNFTLKVTDQSIPPLSAEKTFKFVVSGSGCTSGMENSRESRVFSGDLGSGELKVERGAEGVRFSLPAQSRFSLSVFDLSGREVWRQAGSGNAVWNHGGNLKKGVYLVRAEQNGKSWSRNYCHLW